MKTKQLVLLSITGGLAILYAAVFYTFPENTYFNGDNGMKQIQVLSLLKNDFKSSKLMYPGKEIDKDGDFAPFHNAFCIKSGDDYYGQYSPYHIYPLALFTKIFKERGSYYFIVSGTVLLIFLLIFLSKYTFNPFLFLFFSVFCNPIIFYSFTYYEVIFCTVLFLVFLYSFFKEKHTAMSSFVAGISLSIFSCIRMEGYLYSLVFGLLYMWFNFKPFNIKNILIFVLGFLIGAMPNWWINFKVARNIFGPMLFTFHESGDTSGLTFLSLLWYRLDIIFLHLKVFMPLNAAALIYSLMIAVFILFLKRKKIFFGYMSLLIGSSFIISGILLYKGYMNRSFILQSPLIFSSFFLAFMASEKKIKLLYLASFTIIAVTVLFLNVENPYDWGSRYLIPLYPLLYLLNIKTMHKMLYGGNLKIVNILLMLTLVLSFIPQVLGINRLKRRKERYDFRAKKLFSTNKLPILCDNIYTIQLYAKFYDKNMFFYLTPMSDLNHITPSKYELQFQKWINMLKRNTLKEFILVTENPAFTRGIKTGEQFELATSDTQSYRFEMEQKFPLRKNTYYLKLKILN